MTLGRAILFVCPLGERPRVILFPEEKIDLIVEQIASHLFPESNKNAVWAQITPHLFPEL